MYRFIFTYLLIHQITAFIHDDSNLIKKNNEIINNLFINPPFIKSTLIDVTNHQNSNLSDQSLIDQFMNKVASLGLKSTLDDLKLASQNNSSLPYETEGEKHNIFKRENDDYSETYDDRIEFNLTEELDRIKEEFTPFLITRSATTGDINNKALIREYIISKFNNLRMKTYKQPFTISTMNQNYVKKGVNLFSYYPSEQRKQSIKEHRKILNDQVLVIGAHYDTVIFSPGVDDNASGVINLLELARLLNLNKVNLDFTIIFVCFDFEELGLHGSKAFVDRFLIPNEIIERQSQFLGAYITDMLLNYNDKPNTQLLPSDIIKKVPKIVKISEENQYRGNYVAVWSRRSIDRELLTKLTEVWNKSADKDKFKLFSMDPRLPLSFKNSAHDLGTFIRSDHANFWYPKSKEFEGQSLRAVLLTDLGPWRAETKVCYHKSCDDAKQLTKTNLEFFLHTNKILYKMITENPPKLNNQTIRNQSNSLTRKRFTTRVP